MAGFSIIEDFYSWNTVVEVPVVDKLAPNILGVNSCLYVGVRPEGWGGCASPNSLEMALRDIAGRGYVDGMEIWPTYAARLEKQRPSWLRKLYVADITRSEDIDAVFPYPPGSPPYQLAIWWHGPEHASTPAAGKRGILNCLKLASRLLIGTPWDPTGESDNTTYGGFEGDPENPHESHGWLVKPEELVELGMNVVGLNCRMPEETEGPDHYGHIVAWSD